MKLGLQITKFTDKDYFFKGHFPNNPIVPGVVIVEAMAQTAGVVVSANLINNNDQLAKSIKKNFYFIGTTNG